MTAAVDESKEEGKYRIHSGNDHKEEILTYDQVIHAMNRGEIDGQEYWTYHAINRHRKDPSRPGKWEIKVLWDNGEETREPLTVVKKDNPMESTKS